MKADDDADLRKMPLQMGAENKETEGMPQLQKPVLGEAKKTKEEITINERRSTCAIFIAF